MFLKNEFNSFCLVFLLVHWEVSALQDSGCQSFHQVETQQLVSHLQSRVEWTV